MSLQKKHGWFSPKKSSWPWASSLRDNKGSLEVLFSCILHVKGNIAIEIRGRIGGTKFKA